MYNKIIIITTITYQKYTHKSRIIVFINIINLLTFYQIIYYKTFSDILKIIDYKLVYFWADQDALTLHAQPNLTLLLLYVHSMDKHVLGNKNSLLCAWTILMPICIFCHIQDKYVYHCHLKQQSKTPKLNKKLLTILLNLCANMQVGTSINVHAYHTID